MLWPAADFAVSDLLGPVGVVLFALGATGLLNVARYPRMAEAKFRRSVVDRSLVIVGVVQAAWMIPIVLLAGHAGMAAERSEDTNSAMGLASHVAGNGSAAATVLVVLGAMATLIAVTNANVGFNASLASESLGAIRALRPQARRIPSESGVLIGLIMLAMVGAAGNLIGGDTLSSFLTIGGITGGGVIVVLLPLLAENRQQYRRRYGVFASVAAIALATWATLTALFDDNLSLPLTVVAILVAWATTALTVLAARGVMRLAEWSRLRRSPLGELLGSGGSASL